MDITFQHGIELHTDAVVEQVVVIGRELVNVWVF